MIVNVSLSMLDARTDTPNGEDMKALRTALETAAKGVTATTMGRLLDVTTLLLFGGDKSSLDTFPLMTLDNDGMVVGLNSPAVDLFGYGLKDVKGKSLVSELLKSVGTPLRQNRLNNVILCTSNGEVAAELQFVGRRFRI
eukprot:PhM_4_TR10106/c0_g1_i1/m.65636